MNLNDFYEKYKAFLSHDKINLTCDKCGKEFSMQKTKAQQKIKKYGMLLDKECSMKYRFEVGLKPETIDKLRKARLGKKHTEDSKKIMSSSKKAYFKTPKGIENKKILSKKAVKEHGSNKMNKSKRKVLFLSALHNGEIRVCNSSYEYIACEDFWEKDPTIKLYQTQLEFEVEGRDHSLDVLIEYHNGNKTIIEIKPKDRVCEFKEQIKDCKKYANSIGAKFELWTESRLNIKSLKLARDRADEYRKVHYFIDYAAYRKQKDRDKANRHYANKIAQDKVIIYCDFCKTYHSRLRHQYEANIAKNGRFICIKENGFIVGKQPKNKKENAYADLGMKQCLGKCSRVLPFDCFGKDKSRSDGYASRCKECRREESKLKYKEKTT